MRISIERRLRQPRWLTVAVPVGSVVFAFVVAAIVLARDGAQPALDLPPAVRRGVPRRPESLDQTLIVATPLAFTGLAAAAAFRMKLFNIGAEGQMYIGAITGAGRRRSTSAAAAGRRAFLDRGDGRRRAASAGSAWALIPGILRAFFKTNEILTSLLLNYVAGLLLTYLIFESESYWRQTKGFNATVFPTGKPLPHDSASGRAGRSHVQGGIDDPARRLLRGARRRRPLGALHSGRASASRRRCSATRRAPRATRACACGGRSSR